MIRYGRKLIMRSSILRLAFLFAAGIVFITGCGEGTSAAADNKGSAAVDRKANTPIETARRFVEALWKAEPDTAAAISLSDGEMKKIMKREGEKVAQIKKTAANGDKKAKAALAEWNKAVRETQFVFKGEKIDGELATVDLVVIRNKKSHVEKAFFKKVNGEWKVVSENDYRIANGGRSPADSVKRYLEAYADGDERAARELVSGDSMKKETEETFKKAKAVDRNSSVAKKWHKETVRNGEAVKAVEYVSTEDKAKEMFKTVKSWNSESFGKPKTDSDTDKVKVTYKDCDGNRKETVVLKLKKENGEWKITKIKKDEEKKIDTDQENKKDNED